MRLFEVDPFTYLVASQFEAPATIADVAERMLELTGRPAPVADVVERLARARALVALPDASVAALAPV